MAGGIVVERLEALMRERGYGPGELAYQSGVSYNYIYKIRKGGAPNIAAAQVEKLAKALKTTPAYLRGLTSSPGYEDSSYEIIEGRAELRPETEALAARLDELPDTLRDRFSDLIGGFLDLVGAVESREPDEESAEQVERLARLLDNLTPERRAYWQALIAAEAAGAAQESPGAANAGSTRAEAG